MSNITYQKIWMEAQDAISDILQNEIPAIIVEDVLPTNKSVIYQNLCAAYVKYIQIVAKLNICYDQIVHPQKRRLVRVALDASMGRLIELHNDMVVFRCSENHFFDDILTDLKLSVNDMEIVIPKYFLFERALELQERERTLDEILEKMGAIVIHTQAQETTEEEVGSIHSPGTNVNETSEVKRINEIILLVQCHERARQARARLRHLLEMKEREERLIARKGEPPMFTPDEAATIIQKTWKGYLGRTLIKKLKEEEKIFLGMKLPHEALEEAKRSFQMVQLVEAHRRAIQERHEYEYEDAITRIRDRILDKEAGTFQEEMQDKIRNWFHETFSALGDYPDYPFEDEGGSNLIFEGKLPPEEILRRIKEAAERQDEPPAPIIPPEVVELMVQESNFVPILTEQSSEYENVWKKRDESHNPHQRYDESIIVEEKRKEVREQIRIIVDNAMQVELERLKDALARERNQKRTKVKAQRRKPPVKPKPRKKEKDLTPERTFESLYEELVVNGIIKKFPKVSMTDFIGDYNYLGSYLQQSQEFDTPLALADIRRLVTQYCILPLGSPKIHEIGPQIPALLLVGSSGSGKTMLAHIVCSEAGATLFDLSAINLVDKYPGKDGIKMLLHLVKKVGTLLQPSVILIEDTEKMFYKKIPKEEKYMDPKRLKGSLSKFLKGIWPNERIMLIGTTRDPLAADYGLSKMYDKVIMIPKPDYASRSLLWSTFITNSMGYDLERVDISLLSKVSDGYTAGRIRNAIITVLTEYRKALNKSRPVETLEFINVFALLDPIYKEEEDAHKMWYYTLSPLGMRYLDTLEAGENV
uniref:AAA+ ATPase domain-containing protein n=1 Tax=Strigamia maritima TaxID=126957 RepID=T1J0G2_STRMM